VIDPLETRDILAFALQATLGRPRGEALALETL
jgi:hypothetical protein